MNIEKFSRLVADPSRSQKELKTMLENARNKGLKECVAIAKAELDKRFPGWDHVGTRRGGAKPAIARFLGKEQSFDTSKDAYIWLVEQFAANNPVVFDEPSEDTLYVALGERRNYFGRSLAKLFKGNRELAENYSNYVQLSNGWYANVNLNNSQKLKILMRLAASAQLEYGKDWDFEVLDPSDALREGEAAIRTAKRLLDEL